MAQITVRLRLNKTFTFDVPATDSREAIDAIVDLEKAHEIFLNWCTEEFTIEEAEYDEPEPPEDSDEE